MSNNYSVLFHESPIPSWIYDKETLAFLAVNKSACRLYGYTEDEFLGMTILDIRPTDGKMALRRYLALDQNERNVQSRYWEHQNKKGSTFYVEIFRQPVTYNDKDAMLIQVLDVNDKVLSAAENNELSRIISRQQWQLDNILSSVNELVWAVNPTTMEYLYNNEACDAVLGYTREEITADKSLFFNSLHPDDVGKFQQSVTLAITTGESNCTFRVFHKDGSIKTLSGHAKFRKGEPGEADMLSGMSVDISKQVRSEQILNEKIAELEHVKQKLALEEYNLRALINNTPDMIWSIDRQKRIITANNLFVKMTKLAYGIDVHTGYDMSDIAIPQEQYERWEGYYAKVFAGENFTTIEETNEMGAKKYFKIRFNPIFDEELQVIGVSCFSADVTDQRTKLIKMQLQNERLKEIAQLQSHQVRGPLASMMGLAKLFNAEDLADPVNAEVLEKFQGAMDELDNIIRHIDSKTQIEGVDF
jgi:PAS domain S-box-containing protein